MTRSSIRSNRGAAGFTLVEVLVSVTLLAVAMLSLAPLTLRVAKRSSQTTASSQRLAVLGAAVNRYGSQLFDSLTVGTATTTGVTATFPYSLDVTVSTVTTNKKQVRVVVTPGANTGARADTSTFFVTKITTSSPLNLP